MAAAAKITPAFLNSLKALFPGASLLPVQSKSSTVSFRNSWSIVAAVAFSASNRPDGVQRVFEHALGDLRARDVEHDTGLILALEGNKFEELQLAKKIREALLKSGLISGYPKAINALRALHEVMPEELQDKEISRQGPFLFADTNASLAAYEMIGDKQFRSIYGDQADPVQNMLDIAYPDMGRISGLNLLSQPLTPIPGWFSKTIGYGVIYGGVDTLSTLETSYTLIAALIAGDTPQQISWHLDGAKRGGASLEETRAVRQISIEVAKFAGVRWKHDIPEAA
ncbi:hypothetical protein CPB83DRAFT_837447 [Crepidotus variabilis]|uniref:Carboxymuconolactone decarboxylase-like domain-containing protein n=1 Tax=Crepidotus variabilis TaxID=179855 RepID=A0A9P6ECN6_9AGAR|nr:hypothetical protein CPB83DRAFT_837447 [Crepidotus variabilis]